MPLLIAITYKESHELFCLKVICCFFIHQGLVFLAIN